MFPDRSPRIRHRNELTERDWENAVQGLGKCCVMRPETGMSNNKEEPSLAFLTYCKLFS